VTIAKGQFDPSAKLGTTVNQAEEPSSTTLSGADVRITKSRGLELGIDDPITTGGRYGLSFDSDRTKSNSSFQTLNPAYRSSLSLSITQPLLEGFGIGVNKASIIIARNNQDISLLGLRSELIRTLSEVQRSYWELVFALESLKVQQLALKQAQDLLTINQRFKEVGKASISDVLQAQSAAASRAADVIAAKDAVKDAEDSLKRVTNLVQDEARWDVSILPVDVPSLEPVEVDLEESIAAALENRPEYAQAKLDLQNSDISIKVAKNGKLPTLDLDGSFTLNGLGDDLDSPLSQVGGADYKTWYVGLALRMPIGRRAAKSDLKISQFEKEQKLLALKDMEQQIITEVRGAVRQLETDEKRIEATKAAEDFAKQVLTTEERKHGLQLSTSYEILQFQANLAAATKNHLRAVIDYRKSIVSLYQALGIALEKLNVELE
jgi:outer membrane protein